MKRVVLVATTLFWAAASHASAQTCPKRLTAAWLDQQRPVVAQAPNFQVLEPKGFKVMGLPVAYVLVSGWGTEMASLTVRFGPTGDGGEVLPANLVRAFERAYGRCEKGQFALCEADFEVGQTDMHVLEYVALKKGLGMSGIDWKGPNAVRMQEEMARDDFLVLECTYDYEHSD